jgi:polyhydroxyalkanoate synthase
MSQTEADAAAAGPGSFARLLDGLIAALPAGGRLPLADLARALAARPEQLAALQSRYYEAQRSLWSRLLQAQAPPTGEARLATGDWAELPFFRLVGQTHALNAQFLDELTELAQLPEPERRRLRFVVRQLVDALAPANAPWTNPEVLLRAARSGGASLRAGMRNLAQDLARGRIAMSAPDAFEVGRNVAVTPGAVVHQSPVAQLLHYAPRTPRVRTRPLLIVPPFINKYYILDLQPQNSFVRYALDQGLQVYLLSWRNAGETERMLTWDDYVRLGVLDAIDVALEISGSRSLNALGFCVGGTLLATALSVIDRPARVASLTLLATMLDFTDVGDIAVYVDRDYVEETQRRYAHGGIVPGAQIAAAFASLRASELVWPFVVNGYLKGETPPAFDLLAWNSDSANLPGPLFAWYLRNMYLDNALREPRRLRVAGREVDLGRLRLPSYVLATHADHIVPWTSAYASAGLLAGRIEFVLGASGHVAGVVNPPAAGRRHYWLGAYAPGDPLGWLSRARRRSGSWWSHWGRWIAARSGRWAAARAQPGSGRYPQIEPAPGRYVRDAGPTAGQNNDG